MRDLYRLPRDDIANNSAKVQGEELQFSSEEGQGVGEIRNEPSHDCYNVGKDQSSASSNGI